MLIKFISSKLNWVYALGLFGSLFLIFATPNRAYSQSVIGNVPDYQISSMYVSGDGNIIAVLGATGINASSEPVAYADLLDSATFETLRRVEIPAYTYQFSINYDGSWIAYAVGSIEVGIINTTSGAKEILIDAVGPIDVEGLAFNPLDSRLAISYATTTVIVSTYGNEQTGSALGIGAVINGIAWSPDGEILASTTHQRDSTPRETVQIWSEPQLSGSAIEVPSVTFTGGRPIEWNPSGNLLIAYINNNGFAKLNIVNVVNGSVVASLDFPTEGIADVAWSSDGTQVAAVSSGVISIWDVTTGSLIETRSYPEQYIDEIIWLPNHKLIHNMSDAGLYINGIQLTEPLTSVAS